MGGFGPYEKEVLRRWRSVQHIYTFLKREFERLNQTFFEGLLKPTAFQIHPMRLSKRPLAEHLGAAFYRPARPEDPAEIGIFPNVLLDRDETRIALAHEMVHHWEWTSPEEDRFELPPEIEAILTENLKSPSRAEAWRRHHSPRFLHKIGEIAQGLQIPVGKFLFKR